MNRIKLFSKTADFTYRTNNLFNQNKRPILKKYLLSLLVILVIVYSFWKIYGVIRGPVIEIDYPTLSEEIENDNKFLVIDSNERALSIEGRAMRVSFLFLNNRAIFTDQEGDFSEKVLLADGYNIIEIRGADRFDREIKKTLYLNYQNPN